jgi:hypothetical protein
MNSAFDIKLYCLMRNERYHTTEFRIKTQISSQFIEASDPSLPILTREKNSVLWIRILIHFLLMHEVMSGSTIAHGSGSTYNVKKTTGNEPGSFFSILKTRQKNKETDSMQTKPAISNQVLHRATALYPNATCLHQA